MLNKSLNIKNRKRRQVKIGQELVQKQLLNEEQQLPLVIKPMSADVNILEWVGKNRTALEKDLAKHGGILFRGFNIDEVDRFYDFIHQYSGNLLEYKDSATPRSNVNKQIYTSTDYSAEHWIELHNESAYSDQWPMKIFFNCQIPAQEGGETPILDSRKVYEKMDKRVRKKFEEKQVMYVRNFGLGVGQKWQDVFQTEDKDQVEEICEKSEMQCEWESDEHLRIKQIRPAVSQHPLTKEYVWFNQITAFNITTLNEDVRQELLREYGEMNVPKNTFYGDGTAIEAEVLEEIRRVYNEEMIVFPWEKGDLIVLDNMLVAHGRTSYKGKRKVLVGMTEPMKWSQIK